MLITKRKQFNKKWHNVIAKLSSMFSNKLMDESEFKAGDIVSIEILPDGIGIVRLEEDLTNKLSEVYGIWYTNNDCEIQESDFVVLKEDTRHATDGEIAEYKSALQFHEHGREPFELKVGDLIKDGNINRVVVVNPYMYIKEMFYKSGYELLATVEEVNEWLENK